MRGADLSDLAPVGQFMRSNVLPIFAAVFGSPHLTVIGPGPDRVHIVKCGRNRVNRAALLPCFWIQTCLIAYAGGNSRMLAGEVRTDCAPGTSPVPGFKKHIGGVVQKTRIDG